MIANIVPVATVLSEFEIQSTPDLRVFEVVDYSLFQYGLTRGDRIFVSTSGKPKYTDLAVYQWDESYRAGIPIVENSHWLNSIARFITASKVEFVVPASHVGRLFWVGKIIKVVNGPVVR